MGKNTFTLYCLFLQEFTQLQIIIVFAILHLPFYLRYFNFNLVNSVICFAKNGCEFSIIASIIYVL